MKISRAKIGSSVEDLTEQSNRRSAVEDAELSPSDVDEVILVGGQTRMPKVQSVVGEFSKEPRKDVNPMRLWQWALQCKLALGAMLRMFCF